VSGPSAGSGEYTNSVVVGAGVVVGSGTVVTGKVLTGEVVATVVGASEGVDASVVVDAAALSVVDAPAAVLIAGRVSPPGGAPGTATRSEGSPAHAVKPRTTMSPTATLRIDPACLKPQLMSARPFRHRLRPDS
jgi:hypothetical protein